MLAKGCPVFMISTEQIGGEQTYSRLITAFKTLADQGNPQCYVHRIQMICWICQQDPNTAKYCRHLLHMLQDWKKGTYDPLFTTINKAMMGDSGFKSDEVELYNTIGKSGNSCFDHVCLTKMFERNTSLNLTLPLDNDILVFIDPNGGGSSDAAICAGTFYHGNYVVLGLASSPPEDYKDFNKFCWDFIDNIYNRREFTNPRTATNPNAFIPKIGIVAEYNMGHLSIYSHIETMLKVYRRDMADRIVITGYKRSENSNIGFETRANRNYYVYRAAKAVDEGKVFFYGNLVTHRRKGNKEYATSLVSKEDVDKLHMQLTNCLWDPRVVNGRPKWTTEVTDAGMPRADPRSDILIVFMAMIWYMDIMSTSAQALILRHDKTRKVKRKETWTPGIGSVTAKARRLTHGIPVATM